MISNRNYMRSSMLAIVIGIILDILSGVQALQRAGIELHDVGHFWHITDMHLDPTYNLTNDYPGVSCGSSTSQPLGLYGDFACDSPMTLIHSALHAMKDIRKDVDFLIWTGDSTPHNAEQSLDEVIDIIGNLTDLLRQYFPNQSTPIYSVFGNHDWSPKDQLPASNVLMYDIISSMWSPKLMSFDETANNTFRKSAYYVLPINDQLRMIGLNTNLYYKRNQLNKDIVDPGDQLQWLDDLLTQTAANGSKVMLIGHLPPGMFEKHQNYSWFHSAYNEKFLEVLAKHADTIGSAHFSHHHTDSFRVLRDVKGQPVTSFLLAPAVTPWQTTLPGVMGGTGNNPCIRLVSYDRRTGRVVDVEQHFLELDKANKEGATDTWQLEYRFTEYFQVPDVSTSSLNDLAERFVVNPNEFSLYYEINDAKFPLNRTTWNETMRSVHYCAITRLKYNEYDTCIKERDNQANDAMAHSMAIINSVVFGGLAFLIANL